MKKLFLIIGLVVFLTPVLNATNITKIYNLDNHVNSCIVKKIHKKCLSALQFNRMDLLISILKVGCSTTLTFRKEISNKIIDERKIKNKFNCIKAKSKKFKIKVKKNKTKQNEFITNEYGEFKVVGKFIFDNLEIKIVNESKVNFSSKSNSLSVSNRPTINNNERNSNNQRASNNNKRNQQNQRIYNPIKEEILRGIGFTQRNRQMEEILQGSPYVERKRDCLGSYQGSSC